MPEGVRLGGAYYEITVETKDAQAKLAQIESAAKRGYQAVGKEAAASAQAVERANQRMSQAGGHAAGLGKELLSVAGGIVGITSAAVLAEKALSSIAESTMRAQQAQFALSKTYGAAAPQMAAFAKQFGDSIGRSTTDVQKAAVMVGNLTKEYGFSREQGQQLIRMAADLAAVYGMDLTDATQRLQAAMRGEAESAEVLGLVLNDDAVATRQLGAELKNQWSKLTDAEKAALRFAEAQKQLGERQGAAAEASNTLQGSLTRLTAAYEELGAALGSKFVGPATVAADVLATMANNANDAVTYLTNLNEVDLGKIFEALLKLAPLSGMAISIADAITGRTAPSLAGGTPAGGGAGPVYGPSPTDVATAQAAQAAIDKARRLQELDDAQDAAKKKAKAEIDAIDEERKAKERWYDEERDRIEARRTYQLEDIEARKKAALDAIRAEKEAVIEGIKAQIEEQERLKKARLDAAEAAAEAAKKAIDAEKARLQDVRQAEDRARADQRRDEDRARTDARRAEDRSLADARRAEDRQRDAAQDAEIRRLEALRDARTEAAEQEAQKARQASEQRLRALDREADRVRTASADRVKGIEAAASAEDERHRAAMQALDDEQDARLKLLDVQLDALDAAEKAEASARRTADLQKRVADAQKAAATARGTGTPEQIAEARDELTRALRIGDETSVANARERLATLAGQGNAAIEKADEELAKAQQELRDEGVADQRDAERQKLTAAQEAIKAEIDARKRAEDDENRARKASIDADKEAEAAKLDAALERIDRRKQAEQDAAKATQERLKRQVDDEKEAAQELIDQTKARFESDTQVLQDRRQEEDRYRQDQREAEDRFRDDERQAQDRFRDDEREAQDEALAVQLAAVEEALRLERVATEEHFNGPNGTITQLRRAVDDAEKEYARRLADAAAAYEAERKEAERIYTNPEKNGLLDLLEKARADEIEKLDQSKQDWTSWADAVVAEIKKVTDAIKNAGPSGAGLPGSDSRAAGSGKATAASSATTTSASTGKPVQGTLGTWLNDAMDITGVSDDWIGGLQWLIDHESSGDPYAKNPNSTASGLLQLLDTTWAGNRDKNLPNNVFDPVANLVAGINYIKQRYKHPDAAVRFWKANNYYAAGGWVTEPVLGRGLRSGASYSFAEYGPEHVAPAARGYGGVSLVGPSPSSGWSMQGGSAGHGAAGRTTTVNVSGVGLREVAYEIMRQLRREDVLTGVR